MREKVKEERMKRDLTQKESWKKYITELRRIETDGLIKFNLRKP